VRHRIFVDVIEPVTTVTGDEFHHSVRVVRLREGEEVELFDRAGRIVRGTVETIGRDHARIAAGAEVASRESPLQLHLAMAVIQLEKFELVLQKATELGVRSIVPLITDRVEIRKERYAGKNERWERIVFEAVKQSGRSVVPRVETPAPFAEVVARPGTKIVFDADAPAQELGRPSEVLLFVGPEGGWSEDELRLAHASGCVFQRLGPRRLRAETAAIVAASVITARFGDL
jgi:16S rRNA (uracil1498-N3)-methyltransferase